MTEIYNLQELKALKKMKKDLEEVIPVINTVIKSFQNYKHYIPIASILNNSIEQKSILNAHLKKITEKLKNKGRIDA